MNRTVTVAESHVVLTFSDPLALEHELFFYERFPWAVPELFAVDRVEWTMTVEKGRSIPVGKDGRPHKIVVSQLAYLLEKFVEFGVHHRDVHPGNVVLCRDGVKLIDWETATIQDGAVSYDLYGPVDVPVPILHGGLIPQWWNSNDPGSIKNIWKVEIPEWLMRWTTPDGRGTLLTR